MKIQPRLFRAALSSTWLFALVVVSAFLAGGLAVYQSFVLSNIISSVFLDARTLEQVKSSLSLMLLIITTRSILIFLSEALGGRLNVKVKTSLRQQLLHKIDRLGPEFLKNETTSELTTTALLGVDALDAYFSQYLPQVLIAAMLPLTILAVVFPLDLLTGFIFLLTAPLIPLFMVLIGKAVESLTGKQWKALTRLGDYFLDTLRGIATLKMLGSSHQRVVQIAQINDRYREVTLNVLRVTFLTALALELIATLSTAVVAVEIGLRLLYGRIEFQQAFFILLIAPDFYLPLRNLSARYHAGISGVAAAEKIYRILDTPESQRIVAGNREDLLTISQLDFQLKIRHLSYIYPGQQENALHDVSLDLIKGKHYVLVGKSGAGKSTLARVIMRFIVPDTGQLLLNELDIHGWSREDWHRVVGWLAQSPHIFNNSLRFNLTMGKNGYTPGQIDEAILYAGLKSLVERLPDGLDTPLLEGGHRMSGGELQRVALARVFLRNPQIILLDEPTAHLDPGTQRSLEDTIQRLMIGRTSIMIAHRLSSVLKADEVIFLQAGRIMALGSHTQLLADSTPYREFIRNQGAAA